MGTPASIAENPDAFRRKLVPPKYHILFDLCLIHSYVMVMAKTEVIRVCVSPKDKKTLRAAAKRADLPLSIWARALMMREAQGIKSDDVQRLKRS